MRKLCHDLPDRFAKADGTQRRFLARPRTCAYCGERDGNVERQDDETGRWLAQCSECASRVPDPPVVVQVSLAGLSNKHAMHILRERARRAGICTTCRVKPTTDGKATCEACIAYSTERKRRMSHG